MTAASKQIQPQQSVVADKRIRATVVPSGGSKGGKGKGKIGLPRSKGISRSARAGLQFPVRCTFFD
jgi:hypothetical protein